MVPSDAAGKPSSDVLLRWLLTAGVLSGMALSAGLWGAGRTYPLSPVLPFLSTAPSPMAWLWGGALIAPLLAYAVSGRRTLGIVFVAAAALSVLGDINRLQPWMYQYLLLLGALLAIASPRPAVRMILGCTYLWSGILKLNPIFLAQVAPWLLQPFVDLTPGTPAAYWTAIAMGITEAGAGIALLWPRTARPAACVAAAMHACILLCIGPLGYGWNTVVWPWNLCMIAILLVIAVRPEGFLRPLPSLRRGYGLFLAAAVGVLPALAVFGWWDSYLSFSLYSGNIDEAVIVVPEEKISALPADAQAGLGLPLPQGRGLELMPWAMADLNVPAYPEPRAYKAAFRAVCAAVPEATLFLRGQWTPHRGAGETVTLGCGDL